MSKTPRQIVHSTPWATAGRTELCVAISNNQKPKTIKMTAETTMLEPATGTAQSQQTIMVKMIMDRWHALVGNFSTAIDALSDEQLQQDIAPGKNRGIYLLGHMVAVHDDMIRLLDFGDKQFPELRQPFIDSPDKAVAELPTAKELRAAWQKMNEVLNSRFAQMRPADWFQPHTAVSAEDFVKEPHRNKLNIMLTRSTHLAHHQGQIILIR